MLFSLRNTPQIRAQRELLERPYVLWYNAVCAPIFAAENKDWKIFGGYWAGKGKDSSGLSTSANGIQRGKQREFVGINSTKLSRQGNDFIIIT